MLPQRAHTHSELQIVVRDLPVLLQPTHESQPAKLIAVLSGIERSGVWRLAPHTRITTVLGDCKLDLRRVTISSDITTIDVRVILGSLDLLVPEGIDVDASAILSGREIKLLRPPAPGGLKPVIHTTGTIFCGSVKVRVTPKLRERLKESLARMFEPPQIDSPR